jgi:hypothetical protein
MEIDNRAMMNEMGGAFMVSWLVLAATGLGMDTLEGALVLAAAWMAISGAHILPVVTWMHMMTSDLSDTDGMMANGLRLVMQAVGAVLALGLMTEFGNLEGLPEWTANAWEAPKAFGAMTMVTAGTSSGPFTAAVTHGLELSAMMVLAGAMGRVDPPHQMGRMHAQPLLKEPQKVPIALE